MNNTILTNNLNTIRTEQIDTLGELIHITRDSAKFYGEAALKVANPELKTLFTEMADSKRNLVSAITPAVVPESEVSMKGDSVRGAWNALYTDVRANLTDAKAGFVPGLEASEDRLVSAYKAVSMDEGVPLPVKRTVSDFLPAFRKHHALMRERDWSSQAVAA